MALRSVVSSKMPMVVVLGATGTGKTKLGVELAQKFKTEIISADSMQIYKGLDVVTAKATVQERCLVPHHLLDILEPTQMFTVVDFRNRALKIIDDLSQRDKIPLVVGGTVYYLESIVYKILVENMDDSDTLLWDVSRRKRDHVEDNVDVNTKKHASENTMQGTSGASKIVVGSEKIEEIDNLKDHQDSKDKILESKVQKPSEETNREKLQEDVNNERNFTNEEIHDKLRSVDPVMADRLHPNNRRKVLRSIEVWLKSGRLHSDLLAEQKHYEGQLRRPGSTVIFWLRCDQKVHDERLNARVDEMLKEGLIQELMDFHDRHNRQRIKEGQLPDYTKGIFQTLGFKEFHEYLMLDEDAKNSEGGKKMLEISIGNMKMATRRYARRQNKMIRGRFLEHPNREVPPIYELDTTDITKWNEEVGKKAVDIISSYLNDSPCSYEPVKSNMDEEKKYIDPNSRNYCNTCERLILGDRTYQLHLKSHKHMKVLKKKKLLEEQHQKECNDP